MINIKNPNKETARVPKQLVLNIATAYPHPDFNSGKVLAVARLCFKIAGVKFKTRRYFSVYWKQFEVL